MITDLLYLELTMTKEQILCKLADGLVQYWHDEEGDASDILQDLIISILGTENPELLQQTEQLSEQLFIKNGLDY